jgi:hypothetical protein
MELGDTLLNTGFSFLFFLNAFYFIHASSPAFRIQVSNDVISLYPRLSTMYQTAQVFKFQNVFTEINGAS